LKVDRHNGGSSHLVFGTEDLPPGAGIDRHRHPGADEIILLQNGRARVSLGDRTREVHGGATVFVPANTWISVTNIGTEAISCVFVFSALGFDDFMRAESVPEGHKITLLSKAEDARIMKEHANAVIYAEP
jgi:quercetin dioxygenase-like cupin family protein